MFNNFRAGWQGNAPPNLNNQLLNKTNAYPHEHPYPKRNTKRHSGFLFFDTCSPNNHNRFAITDAKNLKNKLNFNSS